MSCKTYIINIFNYYFPIDSKLIFNRDKIIFEDSIIDNNNYNFLYKVNHIEYNFCKLYNFGYKFITNKIDEINSINEYKVAFPPDNIDSIIITINNIDIIILDDPTNSVNFISSILNFATENTQLDILLYYYLQIHLKNFHKIERVKFNINNKLYEIDHNKELCEIYNSLDYI